MDFDVLIVGGQIVDGAGGPPFAGDVGIVGEKIVAVGTLTGLSAARTINAAGLVISPGFIDMHAHSELSVLLNPPAESKIRQGITTEVVNQCGMSQFPLTPARREELSRAFQGTYSFDVDWTWTTLGEYEERLMQVGVALNHIPLVGHSTVRAGAMGFDNRTPAPDELEEMKRLTRVGMEQGAFGFSTGLTISPSMFGQTDELVTLCRVVAEYGGLYFTHARVFPGQVWPAMEEAVGIGRRAGLPVQVAHMGLNKPYGGRAAELIDVLQRARDADQDITFDVYPYAASSTHFGQLVPAWMQDGGVPAMVERIGDPVLRRRAEEDMAANPACDWTSIMLAYAGPSGPREWEGKMVAEIGELTGQSPVSVALSLVGSQHNRAKIVIFGRLEDDIKAFMRHPMGMFGSDGFAFAPYGPTGVGKPHPRSYGTFPRILGKYVRDEKTMPLQTAIHKMTGFPAERLGLRDRGRIAEGMIADITVFDPATVIDRATFTEPHQYPAGVPYVLVAGQIVIDEGEHTGALPGRLLRRGKA